MSSSTTSIQDTEKKGLGSPKAYDTEQGVHDVDEKNEIMPPIDPHDSPMGGVQRKLKARHLQMIAIGGTIGTGLFVGSGTALSNGGPVGLLLGYMIMGTIVYSMMVALGEMSTLYPISGSFTHYASRFIDPAVGFALGWNYWYSYATTLPTEITAAALVIQFWDTSTNVAVYITVFLVVIITANFCGVRYYGEEEFWFSLIKVTTICGLIILGLVLDLGGGPNHDRIGFRYWKDPGPFNQFNGISGSKGRFLAFWSTFVNAAFSFLGTEIVALTAGEAENPRRNVPKAIRRVFYRILIFYIGGVWTIGWLVPYNDPLLSLGGPGATASPFVIAINNAGIKALPSIINAVVLISAFSAGNSDLYAASRTLYGMACMGQAPRFLRYCTKNGVPVWSLVVTASIGLLAYMNVSTNGGTVFNWFVDISSITGLITWSTILWTYIRFHKALKHHGIDRNTLPYKAPFQPYASYFGLFWMIIIIIFNGFAVFLKGGWNVQNFITGYITVPIFFALWIFWKFYKKTRFVKIADADLDSGRRELDELNEAEEAKYQKPETLPQKIWDWLM